MGKKNPVLYSYIIQDISDKFFKNPSYYFVVYSILGI